MYLVDVIEAENEDGNVQCNVVPINDEYEEVGGNPVVTTCYPFYFSAAYHNSRCLPEWLHGGTKGGHRGTT